MRLGRIKVDALTDVPTTPRKPMPGMRKLRIWEAHAGRCVICKAKIDGVREKWIVEHIRPLGLGGSDTDDNCGPAHERCRRVKDKADLASIAKAKRLKARHIGIPRSSNPMAGGRRSPWKKKMDGTTVRRGAT